MAAGVRAAGGRRPRAVRPLASADLQPGDLLRALALVPAAHAEVDELEAGLLFTARGAGLTWAQIASAMGFKSPQACQQDHTRLAARQDRES